MPDPEVLPSEGMTLAFESATPGTYTAIGGIVSIGSPETKVAEVKTTVLVAARHTYRPSKIPDSGEVTFKVQYDPNNTDHKALYTKLESGNVGNWKIAYADDQAVHANEIFSAFLTSIKGNDKEVDTNAELDLTMRITGAITRTAGAAS